MMATSSMTCTVVAVPASIKEQTKAKIDLSPSKNQDSSIESKQSDSGYHSPQRNGGTTEQEPDTVARPFRSFPFAKDTYRFIRDIGEPSIARYKEISPELEKLLKSEFEASGFFSRRRRLRSISTRLVVLGKTEADATECVVVFCDQQTSKRVAQYLKKDEIIQQLLKPSDPATPSFEIVIKEHPPKLRSTSSNLHVHCDSTDLEMTTFCGLSISFTNCDGVIRCGTFGGVVKVTSTEGDVFVLGVTAAHTLVEWEDSDLDLDEDLELDSMSLSEERERAERPGSASSSNVPLAPQLVGALCRGFKEPFELGRIIASSGDDNEALENPYLDWALFDLNETRPNHLPNSTTKEPIIAASPIASSGHNEFPVLMIGNSQEPKAGYISNVPSRIMIGASTSFTDALLLTLDGGTVCDGESGAWVVNSATLEVVGHVVATDVLGDAYVIPIYNTLADMRRILGAKSVEIPSALDPLLLPVQNTVSAMDIEEHSRDDNSSTVPNIAIGTKRNHSRRKRANSETSGDGENVQGSGREKMTKTVPSPQLWFACPFFKHNPSKCKSRSCAGPGWSSTHRLNEHIFRSHRAPHNRCARCFEAFPSDKDLRIHQVAEVPCMVSQADELENQIDESQRLKLRSRLIRRNKNETERWKCIYLTIFPDAIEIPSPFYDKDSDRALKLSFDETTALEEGVKSQFDQFADEVRKSLTNIVQDTFNEIIEQRMKREKDSEASVIPLEAQEAYVMPNMPGVPENPEVHEGSDMLTMYEVPGPFSFSSLMGNETGPGEKVKSDLFDSADSAYVSMDGRTTAMDSRTIADSAYASTDG